jgi:hypothetical protein
MILKAERSNPSFLIVAKLSLTDNVKHNVRILPDNDFCGVKRYVWP